MNTSKLITIALGAFVASAPAFSDQVFSDDLIVAGSICAGFDCVNGESFGFDTLRLKENNLRIRFDDTSSSAEFPANDWEITVNDTANGGDNKFSITDITGGKTPVTLVAGAPTNSLYVRSNGWVGLGTANPNIHLHVVGGNTPTLRLEQDGSSGFTPQAWDVASNESNFFVRDITNGAKLPFRIVPGAPTSSLHLIANGNVGMGTASPSSSLHVKRTGASVSTSLLVESNGGDAKAVLKSNSASGDAILKLKAGNVSAINFLNSSGQSWQMEARSDNKFFITNKSTGLTPLKISPAATNSLIRLGFSAENQVDIAGSLFVTGNCTEQDGACADYVFEPDYKLPTLSELEAFIASKGHLPNVPSTDQITQQGGVNIASFSGRLLEKIEELTLYTLQQQKLIEQQRAAVEALSARLDAVEPNEG